MENVETPETAEMVETVQCFESTEDLKKYHSLTHLITDNLKARDASVSRNVIFVFMFVRVIVINGVLWIV